uniref:Calmodulin-regulated spectrin-associated protein 2 n=1 Tax=Aceria tosichella TaxID=561515 RepID=A0A6G1SFS5_9ACAR
MENKNGSELNNGDVNVVNNGRTTSNWRSYNGPKLYVKPGSKTNSNQKIFNNAILKALEGAANESTLKKMQETIEANMKTSNHFLILFRNYQFKGIYDYDEKLGTITKLNGLGPKMICPEDIVRFYKFDSTKRQFTEVETKQIGPTIIAISLANFSSK